MLNSAVPTPLSMTDEMTRSNPTLDYTPGELVNLIVSDLGIMTPAVRHLDILADNVPATELRRLTGPRLRSAGHLGRITERLRRRMNLILDETYLPIRERRSSRRRRAPATHRGIAKFGLFRGRRAVSR